MAGVLLQHVSEDPRQRRQRPRVVVAEPAARSADIGQLGCGGNGPRLLAGGLERGECRLVLVGWNEDAERPVPGTGGTLGVDAFQRRVDAGGGEEQRGVD